jgi:acyl carrier protein
MKSEEEIRKQIINIVSSKIKSSKDQVTEATALIGEGSEMDSMKLIELCLDLEDMATKLNFEFDWTSEKAMSKLGSVFMNVETISIEFIKQYKNKK